jgi:hypothetical protein
MTSGLKRYDFYKGPQPVGDLWTLSRGALVMRCALATHSFGWELRLTAGSNFSRSQVCKTETQVTETADGWKAEAEKQGWKAPALA